MSLDVEKLAMLLLHNTAWITVAAALIYWLIRWSRIQSLRWQQLAWFLVLLPAGCLINVRYPVSISTPWPNHQISFDSSSSLIATSRILAAPVTGSVGEESVFIEHDGVVELQGTARTSEIDAADSAIAARRDRILDEHHISWLKNQTVGNAQADRHSLVQSPADHELAYRRAMPSELGFKTIQVDTVNAADTLTTLIRSLVVAWLFGACVIVARYLLQIVALQVALRDCVAARSTYQKQWMNLLKSCRVGKPIQLVEHASLGPMLTITARGWTVIVPSDFWEELTRQQRLGILRHELAHYQNGDVGWLLLARLLTILQWFNPLAWYALRRFDECAELRCDESILRDGSILATDYARALLQLVEYPRASPVFARSAGGASLAYRIGKLLADRTDADSRSKRLLWAIVLSLMFLSAFVRPQFVSVALGQQSAPLAEDARQANLNDEFESQEPATNVPAPLEREAALTAMAKKLAPRGDDDRELVRQFTQAVASPAGQVVMANVVQQWEEQLRQKAEAESTLAFVGEMFERSGEKFVLKKEHAEFPARFEKACRQFDEDTATVARVLQQYGSRLRNDNEADQLVKRYFLDPDAPAQVYVEQVQNRVRPDYRAVREQWEEIFVLDRNNRLVFRSGAKRLADEQFKRLSRAAQMADRLSRALGQWSNDLSEHNAVSKAVRAAMTERLFAAMIATESMYEDYSIDEKIDGYFDYLENIFIDKADGLVPNEEAVAEIEDKLKTYTAGKTVAAKLQPYLLTMAKQLDDSVPNDWRELLTSSISAFRTIEYMGTPAADVQSALQNWLNEWLVESDESKWTVNPEQQEDVINATRERLRSVRAFRRRGLDIVEFGKQIDHPVLAKAYQTTAGKSLVMRSLQDRLSRQYFDGLGAWISDHFDASDDGYTLKEEHEWALQEILSEVDRVKQELANDDF